MVFKNSNHFINLNNVIIIKLYLIKKIEMTNNLSWKKLIYETSTPKILSYLIDKIIESVRVLFQEFSADSSLDIREKSKALLKNLNAIF